MSYALVSPCTVYAVPIGPGGWFLVLTLWSISQLAGIVKENFLAPLDRGKLTSLAVRPGEVPFRLTCAYGITT